MKKIFFIAAILPYCFVGLAQQRMVINPNDTHFIRIIDGLVSTENYDVTGFGSIVHVYDGDQKKALGFNGKEDLLIVNSATYPVEEKILEKIRYKFLESPYPYYVKLPIVFNGELLVGSKRAEILDTLQEQNIRRVTLMDPKISSARYPNAPIGIVEVDTK